MQSKTISEVTHQINKKFLSINNCRSESATNLLKTNLLKKHILEPLPFLKLVKRELSSILSSRVEIKLLFYMDYYCTFENSIRANNWQFRTTSLLVIRIRVQVRHIVLQMPPAADINGSPAAEVDCDPASCIY